MGQAVVDEDVIDDIYEAAFLPERWPAVLGALSKSMEGEGGLLFVANAAQSGWTSSREIRPLFEEFIRDGWAERNPRMPRMSAKNHPGFLRDTDCFTPEEIETDPVYQDFWRKRGLGWTAGTLIAVPTGDSLVFSFEKSHLRGPVALEAVAFLDAMRPHLARAAMMASRLGLERARVVAEALDVLDLPAGVLDRSGALVAANDGFVDLVPSVLRDGLRRVTLTDVQADVLLEAAIERLTSKSASISTSIPIPAVQRRPPMIAHLIPIKRAARDLFDRASALLVVTPVDRAAVPTAEVLQGLFDLTPTEARVARGIGEARTIDDIASIHGSSRETVRSQVKAVLAKTGLSRQSELVSLLAGVGRIG